jgi:hypothetical protein
MLWIGLFFFTRMAALVGRGHGGDDQVDAAGFERGDEALERHVLDVDRAMEIGAERAGEIDTDAGGRAGRIGHLERGIVELHADDERRPGGLGGSNRAAGRK